MKTTAKVVELQGNIAIVETERTSACEGCHKAKDGNGCSVCSLMGSGRTLRSVAQNRAQANVGDTVIVETATSRVLFYAALVFVLPIVLAVCGWFLVGAFTDSSLWRGIGAGVGFVLTFVGLWVYSKSIEKKRCDAVITEIVPNPNANQSQNDIH